jgi:hypothetical protein
VVREQRDCGRDGPGSGRSTGRGTLPCWWGSGLASSLPRLRARLPFRLRPKRGRRRRPGPFRVWGAGRCGAHRASGGDHVRDARTPSPGAVFDSASTPEKEGDQVD